MSGGLDSEIRRMIEQCTGPLRLDCRFPWERFRTSVRAGAAVSVPEEIRNISGNQNGQRARWATCALPRSPAAALSRRTLSKWLW